MIETSRDLGDYADGWVSHAPVGQFRANPFGLHDVMGNVAEWCRDGHPSYLDPLRPGDGEHITTLLDMHPYRGGDFNSTARYVRSASRRWRVPSETTSFIGLRPALPMVR